MEIISVENVHIAFPYEPYLVQLRSMELVIRCLNNKSNGILESPTGTGKTLCLLCSSLAWVQKEVIDNNYNGKKRRVIYATRTHSQISQTLRELQKTAYKNVKVGIMASRQHLCVNSTIKSTASPLESQYKCKQTVTNASCPFYQNITQAKNAIEVRLAVDIEDLCKASEVHRGCPYYIAKERCDVADLIMMPYNYLFNQSYDMKTILNNSIIIFDEAHNMLEVCENSASAHISMFEINRACRDMRHILRLAQHNSIGIGTEDVEEILTTLTNLKDMIVQAEIGTYPGLYIYTLLISSGIDGAGGETMRKKMKLILEDASSQTQNLYGLLCLINFLDIVFNINLENPNNIDECFRTIISSSVEYGHIIELTCLKAAYGMEKILKQSPHSMIFASGTLSPFNHIAHELGLQFSHTLSNDHIIQNNQLYIDICSLSATKEKLDARFKNCDNMNYINALGSSLVEVGNAVQGGCLIFVKTYATLDKLINVWRSSGCLETLQAIKPVFIEPKDKRALNSVIKAYQSSVDTMGGAFLFAVIRGKASEGVNFAGQYGRLAVIIGIPFGPIDDNKTIQKKIYLNKSRTNGNNVMNGDEWYLWEAIRPINQAIGRIVRNGDDFGSVILMDDGFQKHNIRKYFTKWLQPFLPSIWYYPAPLVAIVDGLRDFFNVH